MTTPNKVMVTLIARDQRLEREFKPEHSCLNDVFPDVLPVLNAEKCHTMIYWAATGALTASEPAVRPDECLRTVIRDAAARTGQGASVAHIVVTVAGIPSLRVANQIRKAHASKFSNIYPESMPGNAPEVTILREYDDTARGATHRRVCIIKSTTTVKEAAGKYAPDNVNWNITLKTKSGNLVTLFNTPGSQLMMPLIEGLDITHAYMAVSPTQEMISKPQREIPAKPTGQSCPQHKEGNTMSQVNASIAVQTLTFVFGQRIDTMGKNELFTAAQAVAAQINGLKKSNDSVGSVAIEQEIEALNADLTKIRRLLDDNHAKPVVVSAASVAE